MTLLDFVSELPPDDDEFEFLLSQVEAGEYLPEGNALADWSENDKLVWLRPPEAESGQLCISNENVPEYSLEFGRPQRFTIKSFRTLRSHWRNFLRSVHAEGKEKWLGRKLEFEIESPRLP